MDKAELIDGLQDEYRNWQALLDRISLDRMDQPGVAGPWSVKDIVAHLTGWRIRTVARLQTAGRGDMDPPPPWPERLQTDDEINAWIYEANHRRSVQAVLYESQRVFQQLLAAIDGFPAEILADPQRYPPWLGDQPIRAYDFFAHFHEEHEPDMLAWLARLEKE